MGWLAEKPLIGQRFGKLGRKKPGAHYWDHLPLSQLRPSSGMSKYRLSHRFREVLGVTFGDYLLRVRLERAKVLLAAGHVSVTEVAKIVGFGDLPCFDTVFKRYTGVTPSAYRSLPLR